MSDRKHAVILSPAAQGDFTDILLYTRQHWGEEQRDRYEAILSQAIGAIADFPETGTRCPQLFPGCRAHPAQRHVIYYRIGHNEIEIVRILHERTDPIRQFPG
jgi:toxin ParE1/3/4